VQSSSQIITTNKPTPSFLQAGLPSCHPTNSVKALKGTVSHSVDVVTPSSPGGVQTLYLTTNSSWLPWVRVAMPLISHLMAVHLCNQCLFCTRKGIHLYSIMSPGKMIYAVLEL